METFGVSDMSVDVFKVLSLLRPYDINVPKLKIGPKRDGGYVLAELGGQQDVMSFGVSNDVRFEKALAEKGHRCFLYDHTVDGPPEVHPRFDFQKIGVSGSQNETHELLSVSSHLRRIDHSDKMIMKIDVEGAEWDVFSTIDASDINKFDQIAGEFHWLLALNDKEFRSKVYAALQMLTKHFTLFHVHANNCRPLGFVEGMPVADVIELSFVRSELVERSPSKRLFPDYTDKANNHFIADHALLFFPFLPTHASQGDICRMIERMDEDKLNY